MKHLKKYENKTDWNESEVDVIKDILLEIKDNYPTIDGDILRYDEKAAKASLNRAYLSNPEYTISGKLIYLIKLDCSNIKLQGDIWSLEYYDNKMKFMSLVKEVCYRLETALDVKVKITNFDEFNHWQYEQMKIQLIKI
jgi:hypothetical protein